MLSWVLDEWFWAMFEPIPTWLDFTFGQLCIWMSVNNDQMWLPRGNLSMNFKMNTMKRIISMNTTGFWLRQSKGSGVFLKPSCPSSVVHQSVNFFLCGDSLRRTNVLYKYGFGLIILKVIYKGQKGQNCSFFTLRLFSQQLSHNYLSLFMQEAFQWGTNELSKGIHITVFGKHFLI